MPDISPRPRNVILFGETGVGKSSIINLMAGEQVAETSPNLEACTLEAAEYRFSLSEEVELHIFDTVGLEGTEMGTDSFFGAIEKAHQLIKSLHSSGGIDLLLFCIRGGRITKGMQRTYDLFYKIMCDSQVPVAMVVTNLELEDVMENWWDQNEQTLQGQYSIRPVAHACITSVPARVTMYAQKRAESQQVLRNMLLDTLVTNHNHPYVREREAWFMVIIRWIWSFFTGSESLRRRALKEQLQRMFPREEAERLARLFVGGT